MEKKELLNDYREYNIDLANVDLIIEYFKPGKMANSMIEYDDEFIEIKKNTIKQKEGKNKKKGFSLFGKNIISNTGGNVVVMSNNKGSTVIVNGISYSSEGGCKTPLKISLCSANICDLLINNCSGSVLIKDNAFEDNKEFGSIMVKTTSGDVEFDTCDFNKVSVNSTSGDVKLTNTSGKDVDIHTTSGDISIASVGEFNNYSIESTSGDINLIQASGQDIRVNTLSGDIFMENINTESLNANSTSGDVNISNNSVIKSGKVNTMSGDINVKDTTILDTFGFYGTSADITLDNCSYNKDMVLMKTFGDIRER